MKKLLAVLIILLAASELHGQSQDVGTGLDFLNIGPTSRILSLGEAVTATPTGPSSMYTNPALLVYDEQYNADFNYTLWVADVTNQFAGVNLPKENYSLALGVYNSRSGGFEARNQPGPSQGSFSISYLSIAGAGAVKLGPFSAGATLQYLREEVFQFRSNGYAISGGVSASFLEDRVRLGTSLNNLGRMQELDAVSTTLPTTFRAGLQANIIEITTPGQNDFPVLIGFHADHIIPIDDVGSSDFIGQDDGNSFTVLALSATAANLFYLQGGYKFGPTERPLSFGAGIEIEPIYINYALVPFSTGFGTSHSIGLQVFF